MKIKTILIALLTIFLVFPATAGAAAVGKLTSVDGRVDITSPGKEAKPANLGDPLNVGDIIRAKSKSRCEITFTDGNILRLAENTRLKITEYLAERDRRSEILNLFRGKIQSIVQKFAGADPDKASRYEIHTPTAVAGVRGTDFFAYHQAGITGAVFREGTGYGYSINRPQEIRAITPGQAMVVTNPNLPPTIRAATTQELQQLQKETAPGGSEGGEPEKSGTGGSEPPPPPPPPPPRPPSPPVPPKPPDPVPFEPPGTLLKGTIDDKNTTFSHKIENAHFSGTKKTDTDITTKVSGTTRDDTPVDAAGGHLRGTMDDATKTGFAGYFMGLPEGSNARALVRAIYVTGAGAGFFRGPLSGSFTGDDFTGTGTATQTDILGDTSLAPANLESTMDASSWELGLPLFGDVTVNANSNLTVAAGVAEAEVRGIATAGGKKLIVWGVTANSGTYENLSGSSTLSAYFGKSGSVGTNKYHMFGKDKLSGSDNSAGQVTLSGALDYMDRNYLGTIKFDYNGYNASSGAYRSIGAGDMDLNSLAWSGDIVADYNNKGLYSVSGAGISSQGDTAGGLAGGLSAPWSGTPSLTYMGAYTPSGGQGPYVWTAPLYSYKTQTNKTTYDGGAFFALTGGCWRSETFDADIYGLYVSPTGKEGILKGPLTGNYYPDITMYGADGSWTAVELGSSGTTTDITDINISSPYAIMASTLGTASVSGSFSGGSFAQATAGTTYQAWAYTVPDRKWGVTQAIIGGTFTGTPPNTWYLGTDYINSDKTIATGTETLGTQGAAGKLLGDTRGFAADITATPFTWINVGETIGTYNLSALTWQAVQTAAYVDTDKFLTLAQTDAGRATLQQLNIPAIEVGKATLTGNGPNASTQGNLSVTMSNVTFFASSAGGAPRIWATNGITGSYDTAYGYANTTVPLTGNGLTTNFNVKTWDTAGGKWLSTVTNGGGTYSGTGSMNGSVVEFRGAAAGTINTGAGTIAGTAAGTAK